MALHERLVFRVRGEERREALQRGALIPRHGLQPLDKPAERERRFVPCLERGTLGHEEVGVGRHDQMGVVQSQAQLEPLAQGRQEVQRPSQQGNGPRDGPPAGQTGDALRRDGVEHGTRDILLRHALVQQRPHIHLGEHRAA